VPDDLSRRIAYIVWSAAKYLSGSTSKEIPYEVVYSLRNALSDWISGNCVITTALLEDQNYYFDAADPGDAIKILVDPSFDVELIQIALPKLYKHRPLYNVALYHELGHFLDNHFGIAKYTLLTDPLPPTADGQKQFIHRKEYFADLLAASYTGGGIHRFLSNIAGGHPESDSHPATDDRLANIDDFLSGASNDKITLFQDALRALKLPKLEIRFEKPEIASAINNIRPYEIKNSKELHGILDAGWEILDSAQKRADPPWSMMDEFEPDRVVNDLIEKSIRNWMVKEKWAYGTT